MPHKEKINTIPKSHLVKLNVHPDKYVFYNDIIGIMMW